MARAKIITLPKFKKALQGTIGNKTLIAKKIGVTWDSLYAFMKKNPETYEWVEQEKQKLVDTAEHHLAVKVSEGDWNAIKFALETKGGYSTKQEVTHTGEVQHNLEVRSIVRNAEIVAKQLEEERLEKLRRVELLEEK